MKLLGQRAFDVTIGYIDFKFNSRHVPKFVWAAELSFIKCPFCLY